MKRKLYLLSTKGVGDFYVVAENVLEAELMVTKMLNDANYGFSSERLVIGTKLFSEEISKFDNALGKPFISDANRLIV